jgi:hypothetical protein
MQAMEESEMPAESSDLKAKFDTWKDSAERSVREEPVKTAGLAFVAGLVLTVLPVGRIISGLIRVALALVKPALLILGIVKVVEEVDRRSKS